MKKRKIFLHDFKQFVSFADREDRRRFMPNYEIVYIRDAQVGHVPQEDSLNGQLEHIIPLNNIDPVWIYRVR